jgi:hypothetical protein
MSPLSHLQLHRALSKRQAPILLALLAACDQWALSINSGGLLFISVVEDGRQPPRRTGYRMRLRDAAGAVRDVDLPVGGDYRLELAAPGSVELTLVPPAGCAVEGANPRTVSLDSAEEPVRARFTLHCPAT